MTLRARLTLALLALALAPTAVFTVFTLDQLNRAVGPWYRPGVERALESALSVTKETVTRLETTVMVQATEWAGTWPAAPLTRSDRARLGTALSGAGLSFAQVYRRGEDRWSRIEQVAPEGVLLAAGPDLAAELDAALQSGQPVRSAQGALAGVSSLPNGDVLAVGVSVSPGFFSQVDEVVQGMTYYRRLGVYLGLQRPWIGLLVGGLTVLLVILAVVLARVLARGMSRPLSDLSRAIERVAAGNLDTRVVPRGARELRSLGASFNSMIERLEAARQALQSAEREAAWRDVARKLAHEFKNLLTPMWLALQSLEDQVTRLPEDRRAAATEDLQTVRREAQSLKRLAEQFSQYARLPQPNLERIDLTEVVRSTARLDRLSEIRAAPAEAVWVRADRLLLSRAVHNLLLNASEAAPAGTVEVRIVVDGPQACVEVLDRGPGLPAGQEARLFEPYVSTKKRGSGLGLSLVRDIALQHGGDVRLENREGGGARARLSIPLASEARAETAAP